MPREARPRPKQRVTGGDEEKVLMVCVARALGSLGDYDTLRKAVNYSYSKESKLTFAYSEQVVQGSLQGMAYLPREKDPIASLQRLNRLLPDPGMNRVCAEAMLEAWRLSRGDARGSTEREGT
jgi:hypothetical protein